MLVQVKSLIALAVLAGALPFGYSALWNPGAAPQQATEHDLVARGALARAGLAGPELAVAGVTGPQVSQIVLRAQASNVVSQNRLAPASETAAAASALVSELEEAVRGGDRERLPELEAARVAATAADAAVEALIAEVFNAATQGQPASVIQVLQQVDSNQRYKRLPLEFLVSERSASEWATLKEALNHERICTKLGEPTDPAIMQRLAAFRAEEAVAAARARLEANGAAVESAWSASTAIH